MSASTPPTPRQLLQQKRKRAVKIVGMIMSALMVIAMLTVLALIVRNERAHDEQTCKFTPLSERTLGRTTVREESRRCLPELEERRYLVERAGEATFELARKRMPPDRFAADRYLWTMREDTAHKLVVRFDANGKLLSEFFEEDSAR